MANAEDGCTGHFWEARFHSEPLCSEQALIAAMAYVDLNPIRAKLATTPEQSAFTSISARLLADDKQDELTAAISRMLKDGELHHFNAPIRPLMEFSDTGPSTSDSDRTIDALPIYQPDYLSLVDATGRIVVHGKRGRINPKLEPILLRLNLSMPQWIQVSSSFKQYFYSGYLRLTRVA